MIDDWLSLVFGVFCCYELLICFYLVNICSPSLNIYMYLHIKLYRSLEFTVS